MSKTKTTIPELPGYLNLPRAALFVGLSRQRLHDMAHSGKLRTVVQIAGLKRTEAVIVKTAELRQIKLAREAAKACPECLADVEKRRAAGETVNLDDMVCEHFTPPEPSPEDAADLASLGL